MGQLGAEFDLRGLPVTSALIPGAGHDWRQVKGDPAIRGTLFQQTRAESPMDRNMQNALSILEELLTERGVFQCQIHFSSSQATIWTIDDPLRYRILDQEVLHGSGHLPALPVAAVSRRCQDTAGRDHPDSGRHARRCAMVDNDIYLRTASVNIFNGMVSLTFSCDGSHYMRYDEFLAKGATFWSGVAE